MRNDFRLNRYSEHLRQEGVRSGTPVEASSASGCIKIQSKFLPNAVLTVEVYAATEGVCDDEGSDCSNRILLGSIQTGEPLGTGRI